MSSPQEKGTETDATLTLQKYVDAMNQVTDDDYVYTRAQLAAAESRSALASTPLSLAANGVASFVADR